MMSVENVSTIQCMPVGAPIKFTPRMPEKYDPELFRGIAEGIEERRRNEELYYEWERQQAEELEEAQRLEQEKREQQRVTTTKVGHRKITTGRMTTGGR